MAPLRTFVRPTFLPLCFLFFMSGTAYAEDMKHDMQASMAASTGGRMSPSL
jgi:hypothetical protein